VRVQDVYGAESSAATPVSVGASAASAALLASRLDGRLAASEAAGDVDKTLQVCHRNLSEGLVRWQCVTTVVPWTALGGRGAAPCEGLLPRGVGHLHGPEGSTHRLPQPSLLASGRPLCAPLHGHVYRERHCATEPTVPDIIHVLI
jgi:hypothetical protein